MFAVCVTFEIAAGDMAAFIPLVQRNAQISLANEPGCQRFDVLTEPSRPQEVFLYELYDDAAAFQFHLETAHFRTFDQAVETMIAAKTIRTYTEVTK